MLASLRNTTAILFRHSWITVLLALILPALYLLTFSGWVILLNFGYFFPAAIIHYKGKRWIGFIASLLSLMVTVFLTFLMVIGMAYFPEPSDVHDDFASRYENREEIESITGISIPEFTVDSSKITHISQFDFEFTSEAVIRFKTPIGNKTFQYLDSLCEQYTPPSVDTIQDGNPQPEPTNIYWSKEKNAYHFSLFGYTESKKLHSEDAFFSLTIKNNSPIAELRYGNY